MGETTDKKKTVYLIGLSAGLLVQILIELMVASG